MKSMLIHLFYFFLAVCPQALKRHIYNRFLGADIHPTARIGPSYVRAKVVRMGPKSSIGHFNIIKGLTCLELDEAALIGSYNRISAVPEDSDMHFGQEEGRRSALIMGEHSAITSLNYFDCSNTVNIGKYATIVGLGSAFFTHGINIATNRQESAPISIGDYSMVAARCVVVKGGALPSCSVLGANSTLHKAFTEPYGLYSGVPARLISTLDPGSAHFGREKGRVD